MEVEGHLDAGDEPRKGNAEESTDKWGSSYAVQPASSGGCFDCNICLEYAVEPVVTRCGHLYCWPCIYKWLRLESPSPQPCPVCKASISEATLVPLYGRGHNDKGSQSSLEMPLPRRPMPSVHHRDLATDVASVTESELPAPGQQHQQQEQTLQRSGYLQTAPSMAMSMFHPLLGGNAIAVLPWVLGSHGRAAGPYYSNPYYLMGSGSCPRLRRQEMQARRSLHRVSIFLFHCLVLCLLLF